MVKMCKAPFFHCNEYSGYIQTFMRDFSGDLEDNGLLSTLLGFVDGILSSLPCHLSVSLEVWAVIAGKFYCYIIFTRFESITVTFNS